MKKFKYCVLLMFTIVATALITSCGEDYDDTALRNDVNDLKSRVEKLETWCTTVNSQIGALQELVTALEAKDYVTGVSPLPDGDGYTITFTKSGAITIKNGEKGTDGIAPVIGVKKDATDGFYYWTVKTGDADATWLTDSSENRIRTTGDDAKSPEISVATAADGKVYWKVNDEWLEDAAGNKVPATGETGDAIFLKDGIDLTDADNVTFILNDGKDTKITLPRTSEVVIFTDFSEVKVSPVKKELVLNLNVKEDSYAALKAELTSSKGMTVAMVKAATRALPDDAPWSVAITNPTFKTDKTIDVNGKVTFDFPANAPEGDFALLKVTVIDKSGKEHASTRVIVYTAKVDIESFTLDHTALDVYVGNDATLAVTILPSLAVQDVTWESNDRTVATVDVNGKVTGVKAGTATITATSTDDATKTATCTVTVKNVDVTGVTLDKTAASIAIDETVKLTATIAPGNATDKNVTWSSDDETIATVATDGTVTGVAAGDAIITVTTTDGTKTATCTVTVTDVPTIIGNYYFSDGTYSATLDPDKTAIGIVFWEDPNNAGHGKIVSMNERKGAWSSEYNATGATSATDGLANINTIKSIANYASVYPAVQWCVAKTEGGKTWYIPAIDELKVLWSVYTTFNSKLTTPFTSGGSYWSSTEVSDSSVSSIFFKDGRRIDVAKTSNFDTARAIATF